MIKSKPKCNIMVPYSQLLARWPILPISDPKECDPTLCTCNIRLLDMRPHVLHHFGITWDFQKMTMYVPCMRYMTSFARSLTTNSIQGTPELTSWIAFCITKLFWTVVVSPAWGNHSLTMVSMFYRAGLQEVLVIDLTSILVIVWHLISYPQLVLRFMWMIACMHHAIITFDFAATMEVS